jgi:hypothetical protein
MIGTCFGFREFLDGGLVLIKSLIDLGVKTNSLILLNLHSKERCHEVFAGDFEGSLVLFDELLLQFLAGGDIIMSLSIKPSMNLIPVVLYPRRYAHMLLASCLAGSVHTLHKKDGMPLLNPFGQVYECIYFLISNVSIQERLLGVCLNTLIPCFASAAIAVNKSTSCLHDRCT